MASYSTRQRFFPSDENSGEYLGGKPLGGLPRKLEPKSSRGNALLKEQGRKTLSNITNQVPAVNQSSSRKANALTTTASARPVLRNITNEATQSGRENAQPSKYPVGLQGRQSQSKPPQPVTQSVRLPGTKRLEGKAAQIKHRAEDYAATGIEQVPFDGRAMEALREAAVELEVEKRASAALGFRTDLPAMFTATRDKLQLEDVELQPVTSPGSPSGPPTNRCFTADFDLEDDDAFLEGLPEVPFDTWDIEVMSDDSI